MNTDDEHGTDGGDSDASRFPADWFSRVDESDDAAFYQAPRLVAHIDETTIAALTDYYREVVPAGGTVLDLMSSWISHLPADVAYAEVMGHGMNQAELDANPRLDGTLVQDLNVDPTLPFADGHFDAALIAVSVQYLTRPLEVFAELGRVLAPGGRLVIATSHRCFPTKAVRAFHLLPPAERMRLIMAYMDAAATFDAPEFVDRSPDRGDPLWVVTARRQTA